jgi:hypothetical protein
MAFVVLLIGAALTAAQPPPSEETVAVDPIRCWWRSSAGAVRVGESFSLVLTCAVLENDAVQVAPDESRLGPTVMTLAPFEVVGGSHPADIRRAGRRFFQYHYDLRIINRDMIGTDVALPVLELHYRVNSRIAGNAALEGRDLTYLLPPQQIRILSTVPQEAADIRDSPGAVEADFAAVEALQFRANLFQIVAVTLMALGAMMAVGAAVRLLLRARRRGPTHERRLGESAMLRLASRDLASAVRDSEAAGWGEAAADRAMSVLRIAAAVALGRTVNQRVVSDGAGGRPGPFRIPASSLQSGEAAAAEQESAAAEGRVLARLGRRTVALSSPVTHGEVAHALMRLSASAEPVRRHVLEDLDAALATFTRFLYGRPAPEPTDGEPLPDRAHLDEGARRAASAIERLLAERRTPAHLYRRWVARVAQTEGRA